MSRGARKPQSLRVCRQLGSSPSGGLAAYAVDPFCRGIYAGDPMKLETRHALPKLYNLEQELWELHSWAWQKAKEPKSARDRLAAKEVTTQHVTDWRR